VQAAAEKFDIALATLESVDSGRFAANYAEVRGDILLAQGKPDQARAAYQLALKLSIDGGSDENSVLQSKVNDLTSASQAMAKPLAAVEVQQ
jgi:predicted negative regulator of RcsB-dependent stress response